jgi:hypothetical protein
LVSTFCSTARTPVSTEVEEPDKQRRRAAWVPGEASPVVTARTPISTEVEESDKQRRRAAWVPGEASPTATATTVEASSAWAVAYCSASYAIPIFMLLWLETGKSMPQRCGEWMGVFTVWGRQVGGVERTSSREMMRPIML